MTMQRWPPVVVGLLLAAPTLPLQAREAPVYRNGTILTMVGPAPTIAEAVVERGGRIVHVGALAAALRLAGAGARQVNLAGVISMGALLEWLRQHASSVPPGE